MKNIKLLFFLSLVMLLAGNVSADIIEISQLSYATTNHAYDRNPSVINDGSNFWLFYTKGDDVSTDGVRGTGYNPDNDNYVVYYKKAATVEELSGAGEVKLALSESARPTGFDQRVVSAVKFGESIYAFVSSGFSPSASDKSLYYYVYNGSNWSGPIQLIGSSISQGGYVNVATDGNRIYIVWECTDGSSDAYTWDGSTLSSKIDVSPGNMPKITVMPDKIGALFAVNIEDGTGDIEVFSAFSGPSPTFSAHSTAISGGGFYDPCIFNDGTDLYIVSAPWVAADRQYLVQTKSEYASAVWSETRTISYGGYGVTEWWDYWPCGYFDGFNYYLFFTTETNSPVFSDGEIGFIKIDWDLSRDHYFYIQNGIDQAVAGDTVNLAAGTYTAIDRALAIINKPLTLNGAGQTNDASGTILLGGTYGAGSDGTGVGNAYPRAVIVQADNITIKNMRIKGYQGDLVSTAGYAVIARASTAWGSSETTIDNLTVENLTMDDCYYGIRSEHVNNNVITNTSYEINNGSPAYAVYITYSQNTLIRANTYDQGAIWVTASSKAVIGGTDPSDGNVLTDIIYNGIWYGQQFVSGSSSEKGLIQNNIINGAVEGGIVVWNWPGELADSIFILDNYITGVAGGSDEHGGISIYQGEFTNLVINGNTSINNDDNQPGLSLTSGTLTTAVITNNVLTGNPAEGIRVNYVTRGEVTIHDNNLSGNTIALTMTGGSTSTLNASGNWWGYNNPAAVSTQANGGVNVDYTPWLNSDLDTSSDPGFQGDFASLWVDDNSQQYGTEGRIQEGLDMTSGSTVNVAAGTYAETIDLGTDFNNGSLVGDIASRPYVTGGIILGSGVAELSISNFYITGPTPSENTLVRALGTVSNLTLDNCVFDGENVPDRNGYTGGSMLDDVTVTGCEFKNILGWAVLDSRSGSGGDGSAMGVVTFADNHIHECNGSIVFRGLSTDWTDRIDLYGNTWENIGGNEGYQGQHWAAFELNRAYDVNVYDNTVDGVALGQWGEGQAMQIWEISDLDVHDNTFVNCAQGIYVWSNSGAFPIPGGAIYHNTIMNNSQYNVKADPDFTSGMLNAETNYWGSLNESEIASTILGLVDYDPWCNNDFTKCDFTANPTVVWVDDDYTPVGGNEGHYWGYDAFAVVQDGINTVSAGGTVNILPGSYEEQIVIDKNNLSLLGSGNGTDPGTSSLIVSPASLTYYFIVGSNNNYPIVGIHDATGVTIDNVRIDGAGRGSGNYRFTGIGFWNAGGDVTGNHITGLRESPYNGNQHGVGIYAYNNTGGPYTINVSGTTVDDFQKNGITLLGDGLTANVDGSTITGQGSTAIIAQNGIQIGYGAGGSIEGCAVSDISYNQDTWLACGVLMLYGTSVDMSGNNTIDNCMVGVMYQETSGSVDGLKVNSGTDDFCAGLSLRDDGAILKTGDELYLPPVSTLETDLVYHKLTDKALVTTVDVNNIELIGTHSLYGYGISAWGYGDNINLTVNNSLVRDWEIGLVAYEAGGTVSLPTHHTKIYNNDAGYYAGTALVQNAENNWWGSLLGPYHPSTNPYGDGDEVTDNVDYEPWCNEDFSVCHYTAEPSEVWVDDDYTEAGVNDGHVWGFDAFNAIQDGIDAVADQGTVHVLQGTFTEQLRIDSKSLDLIGAGIGLSIIEAVPVEDRVTYSITQWESSVRTINACIGVTDAAEVNITGFTIDGQSLGPDNFYGVHYFNTSGTISESRVQHITDALHPTYSRVVSLVATHGDGETADISFIKVEVPDFQKGGIVTMGPGIICTLEDNDIDGAVNPNLAPNGIQVSYGASGILTDNSVTSVEYPGTDWAGTGILLMESGNVTVTGGEVIGCEVGVGFSQWNWIYTQTTTPTIIIDDVTFTSNQWAVETHLADDDVNLNLEVTNCVITNSTYVGIELWGSDIDPWGGSYYSGWTNGTLNVEIHGNHITDGDEGVEEYVELTTGNIVNGSVTGNSLSGNTGYGVYNNFTNLLDATSNWWGDASGPDDGSKIATGEVLKRTAVPYEVSDKAVPVEYYSRRDSYAEKGSGTAVTANVDYSPWWGADYVGDDHSGVWYLYVNTSNGSTIQEAMDLALNGDVINVAAGTYSNDIHVLDKNITLNGAHADDDPAGSTDRGGESILTRNDGNVFEVQPTAAGAIINGFKFGNATVNSGRHVYIDDAPGVIVEYCIFLNTSAYGIAISDASDGTQVMYNTIDNSVGEGIVNFGSDNVLISRNTIQNVENYSISTDGRAVISYNTVVQCKDGIRVAYPGTSALDRVEVADNAISYTSYAGINISGAYTYVYNNNLHHCNYYGSDGSGDWDYASIHLERGAISCTVDDNTVYDGINGIQSWANNVIIS
ncbi:MAG: right-handed parallel beta-helix repeat-containing protein, partial [Candidatus Zixiibacteriota bacterium]